MSNRKRAVGAYTVSLATTAGAAVIGNLATRSSVSDWYPTLKKPPFNPPAWVFGPVWSALYLAMATAAWRVWRAKGDGADEDEVRHSTMLYGVQLTLNSVWSLLFFGLRSPTAALVEIGVLWGSIVAWYRSAGAIDRPSRWLILPYVAWTTFSAALNASIWWLNRE